MKVNNLKIDGKTHIFSSDGDYLIEFDNEDQVSFVVDKKVNITIELKDINVGSINFEINELANVNFKILNKIENNLNVDANLKKEATFHMVFGDFYNGNSKFIANINLNEDGANSDVVFSSVANENYKKNYEINFNHNSPLTTSNIKGFGVALKKSEINVKGVSHIKEKCIKSQADQSIKIILFDKESRGLAKPILKIDNEDIKASHACAIGSLNDEHLYYLLSRGINEKEARNLIVLGYILPIKSYFNKSEQEFIDKFIEEQF